MVDLIIKEILSYCDRSVPGYRQEDIMEGLYQKLFEFIEHDGDQATELFALSEEFPESMDSADDDKIRAWLILIYEKYIYQVPTRGAVEDALAMINARRNYGDEFWTWIEERDKERKAKKAEYEAKKAELEIIKEI